MRLTSLLVSAAWLHSTVTIAQNASNPSVNFCSGCVLLATPQVILNPASTTYTIPTATVTTNINAIGRTFLQTGFDNAASTNFLISMSSLYQGSVFTVISEDVTPQTVAERLPGLQLQTATVATQGSITTCVSDTMDIPTSDVAFPGGAISDSALAINTGVESPQLVTDLVHAYFPGRPLPTDCALRLSGPSVFQVYARFVATSVVVRNVNFIVATNASDPALPSAGNTTTSTEGASPTETMLTTTTTNTVDTTTEMVTTTTTGTDTDTTATTPTTTAEMGTTDTTSMDTTSTETTTIVMNVTATATATLTNTVVPLTNSTTSSPSTIASVVPALPDSLSVTSTLSTVTSTLSTVTSTLSTVTSTLSTVTSALSTVTSTLSTVSSSTTTTTIVSIITPSTSTSVIPATSTSSIRSSTTEPGPTSSFLTFGGGATSLALNTSQLKWLYFLAILASVV